MSSKVQRVLTDEKIVTVITTVTEEDRCVDYADLLAAVMVEPDNYPETPWEDCDGYEHTSRSYDYRDHDEMILSAGNVVRTGRSRCGTRVLEFDSAAEKDFDELYRYYRSHGASKGVANELVALSRKERMDQLVQWYENGWEYWYVCAEFNGYQASGCGGIDDYDYADTEVRSECADELAAQLEADGFIITGKPEPVNTYLENRKYHISRMIGLFNWR